jgi:hypothetical protein
MRTGWEEGTRLEAPCAATDFRSWYIKPVGESLFADTTHYLGRNLVRVMRPVGITDARKVGHSLRH